MALACRQLAVRRTWITGHSEVFEYLQMAAPFDALPRYLPKGPKNFHNHIQPGGGRLHGLQELSCNAAQLFIALIGLVDIVVLCFQQFVALLPPEKK
jgi:hypothetical protein